MGVPPFMVATSLQAVIAQRLVRLNCPDCAQPHEATVQEQSWLTSMLATGESVQSLRGRGCSSCNGTGYSGRQGVYELLEMDAALTQAASRSDPAAFMKLARERMQGRTMAAHALELVRQGRTSLSEALRIGFDVDDAQDQDSVG
jgi:MSHA biogenesis protein MshE